MSLFLSEANNNCSDFKADIISSPTECQFAMKHLTEYRNSIIYGGEVFNGAFPKGCFILLIDSQEIAYWNYHSFGSDNINARQLCIQNGKYFSL